MSNRSKSKQHGLVHHVDTGNGRPKSKLRKRTNKISAAMRREQRRADQAKRLEAARKKLSK